MVANQPSSATIKMKKKVLILSGPTREQIDPVRFISNESSGKTGRALAMEAGLRGAKVDFISGPVGAQNLPEGTDLDIYPVTSALEMLAKATQLFQKADIIIFVAAVADYTPATQNSHKLPKSKETFALPLTPTPDIAQTLSSTKSDTQTTIGFALETGLDSRKHAREKLESKCLNGIVLNSPSSLNASKGTYSYLARHNQTFEEWGQLDKSEAAFRVLTKAGLSPNNP